MARDWFGEDDRAAERRQQDSDNNNSGGANSNLATLNYNPSSSLRSSDRAGTIGRREEKGGEGGGRTRLGGDISVAEEARLQQQRRQDDSRSDSYGEKLAFAAAKGRRQEDINTASIETAKHRDSYSGGEIKDSRWRRAAGGVEMVA